MKHEDLRLPDYLGHIVDAVERINRYTEGMDEATYSENSMVQDAVIRNIEIIGEASNNIRKRYPDFAERHTDLPLAIAYETRNAISHGYFSVDHDIVWKTIRDDLPMMKRQVEAALNEAKEITRSVDQAPKHILPTGYREIEPNTVHGQYTGKVLDVDGHFVFQDAGGRQVARHERARLDGDQPAKGQTIQVRYNQGRATVKDLSREQDLGLGR